jgi:hypothetical protein
MQIRPDPAPHVFLKAIVGLLPGTVSEYKEYPAQARQIKQNLQKQLSPVYY